MKKITALMFAFMMLVTFAAAQTAAKSNVKKVTMSTTAITTDGQAETEIEYNGVTVSVPQGVKATVSKDAQGNIIVSGSNLSGVKIDGDTVNSNGKTTLSVNPTTKVMTVKEGNNVTVTNAKGETYAVKAGQSTTQAQTAAAKTAKPAAAASEPVVNVPSFVIPSTESAANQQAVQNVEETLSSSTPGRN